VTQLEPTLSARSHLLWVWRACLVLAALATAFAYSLALRPGSALWWVATGVLVVTFLGCYLFYLPARLQGLSLILEEENLVLRSGVFSSAVRTVPMSSVQYARVKSSPLHRWLGLCTLEVVCAGGRAAMPGISGDEAQRLVSEIFAHLPRVGV